MNRDLIRFLFDRSIVLLFFIVIIVLGIYNKMVLVTIAAIVAFILVTIVTIIDYREDNWRQH